MGRWAYFNTGVSYKFAHGQSSYDITELFSDYDENSYEDQSGTSLVSWNTKVKEEIKEWIDFKVVNDSEFPKVVWDSFEASAKGTEELLKKLYETSSDVVEEILYKYILACIIYHQLTYVEKLSCEFEVD